MRQDLDQEAGENEDEDSGGDEHPALRNSLNNSRRYRLFKTFIFSSLGLGVLDEPLSGVAVPARQATKGWTKFQPM
jgi:hypothetical protein